MLRSPLATWLAGTAWDEVARAHPWPLTVVRDLKERRVA
jgi:hypothetical protein